MMDDVVLGVLGEGIVVYTQLKGSWVSTIDTFFTDYLFLLQSFVALATQP